MCANDDQTFWPLTTKRLPSGASVIAVWTAARSEPAFGSLMPMQTKHWPAAIRGSSSCFCASEPYLSKSGPVWRSAIQCAATGAPAARSSSITT